MLVHSVYFWLDKNSDDERRQEFQKGLESLKGITEVDAVWIGKPGPTKRPVVDRTYDFALTVLMKDMKVHDAYQEHPLHKRFLENYSKYWIKVVIFDHEG